MDDSYLETAIQAARLGGAALESWTGRFTVAEKGPANLVTDADFASQEVVVGHLRHRFPDHGFLGEEGLDDQGADAEFRWIIDPLDGTSNYVHRFPYYAVSIGLEHRGELIAGVIFDPNRNEVFAAKRGGGAWLNGVPIRPSKISTVSQAFVVASLPVGVESGDPAVLRFLKVLPVAQTVQRTGSAALNLAYVACGRIDAFWSSSLKPWDVAGGALIVTEAGGLVSKMTGESFATMVPDLLASNGSCIHEELSVLLTRHLC